MIWMLAGLAGVAGAQELNPALTHRIDAIEGWVAGEALPLAIDSRIELAALIGKRDPKRTARLAGEAISLAAGLERPRERAALVARAAMAMAAVDFERAAEAIETLPLVSESEERPFPREQAYEELFRLWKVDDTWAWAAILRRALNGGACPVASAAAVIGRLREVAPDEAATLSPALLACVARHPVNTRVIHAALRFFRQCQEVEPAALETFLAAMADQVEARDWGEIRGERDWAAYVPFGKFEGTQHVSFREPELLRVQIAGLARQRFPALAEKLRSLPAYGDVWAKLDSVDPNRSPSLLLASGRNLGREVQCEEMGPFRLLDARSQLEFARGQRDPEIRAELLAAYLAAEDRTPAEGRRVAPELLDELELTRPGRKRTQRGIELVSRSGTWGDEALVRAAGAALARSMRAECGRELEEGEKSGCRGVYDQPASTFARVPAAREAAAEEDVSLRVRLALRALSSQ